MGYISSRKLRLQSQLTRIQSALSILYDTYAELAASTAQSYAFDSGEGSQKTTRRDLSKILDDIERLEATEAHIVNELYSMGLVSIRLRRKR